MHLNISAAASTPHGDYAIRHTIGTEMKTPRKSYLFPPIMQICDLLVSNFCFSSEPVCAEGELRLHMLDEIIFHIQDIVATVWLDHTEEAPLLSVAMTLTGYVPALPHE